MKPPEPQMRRVVVFCIRENPRKKVKKSKSSLLRGVNEWFGKRHSSKIKAILKKEVLLRDSRDALLSMSKRLTLWTMSYSSLTKNKQTNKQKQEKNKAISKRRLISLAGIDDRFTLRCFDRSSSENEEPGRHDSAITSKTALIFSSSVGPDLQEEKILYKKRNSISSGTFL